MQHVQTSLGEPPWGVHALGLTGSLPPRPETGRLWPAALSREPCLSSDLDISANLMGVGVPGFGDLLGDSAQIGKCAWGEVKGRQAHVSRAPSGGGGVLQDAVNSPARSCDNVCDVSPQGLIRDQRPRFLSGPGHAGSLRLARTQIPDPRGEQGSAQAIVVTQFMPIEALQSPGWEPQNPRSQTPAKGPA